MSNVNITELVDRTRSLARDLIGDTDRMYEQMVASKIRWKAAEKVLQTAFHVRADFSDMKDLVVELENAYTNKRSEYRYYNSKLKILTAALKDLQEANVSGLLE